MGMIRLIVVAMLLLMTTSAFAQNVTAFIVVERDGEPPAFWWKSETVSPTTIDLALMQAAADAEVQLFFPKSGANISKIYRTPDLTANNAKNFATTFGVTRFFLGKIRISPIEPFMNITGVYARAELRWQDETGERDIVIERAAFSKDLISAEQKLVREVANILARLASEEGSRKHADIGLPFESNDVLFEAVPGKHLLVILGQLEKSGFPNVVVWASGGRVVVRFSKPVEATLKQITLEGATIDAAQQPGKPLRVRVN